MVLKNSSAAASKTCQELSAASPCVVVALGLVLSANNKLKVGTEVTSACGSGCWVGFGSWDGNPEMELLISSREFCEAEAVEVTPNMSVLRVPFSCV